MPENPESAARRTSVVFCPHPPLLAAGSAVGAVPELDKVRAAALDAVGDLVRAAPRRVLVLAADDPAGTADESVGGTLAAHGIDVAAGGQDVRLGLGHTVGAWLLDRAGWRGERRYVAELDASDLDADVAVLVMADGTATRSERAPGFLDERAEAFDATVAAALADGDPDTLGGIDLDLADALWCQGGRVWRATADAVASWTHGARTQEGAHVAARLRYDGAPLGVGWVVADWTVTSAGPTG